jgi:hypothetical protein
VLNIDTFTRRPSDTGMTNTVRRFTPIDTLVSGARREGMPFAFAIRILLFCSFGIQITR